MAKNVSVEDLDLPEGVTEILIKNGIKELYPPQAEAVFPALDGKNAHYQKNHNSLRCDISLLSYGGGRVPQYSGCNENARYWN